MNRRLTYLLLICPLFFFSCEKEETSTISSSGHEHDDPDHTCTEYCREFSTSNKNVFEEDGEIYLWGGQNEDWHFLISDISIDVSKLKFGLGRETFMALMEPRYQPISDFSPTFFNDSEEFILVESANETKAFPIDLMIKHEVINDVMDGKPIMVAYCVLADFAGVYSRNHCGQTFTFAVSGYTYSEEFIQDGKDGFILWDRDTESLWWPLANQAVSGGMNGEQFNKNLGDIDWSMTTWAELKSRNDVLVLKYNQSMEPPIDYPRIDPAEACQ